MRNVLPAVMLPAVMLAALLFSVQLVSAGPTSAKSALAQSALAQTVAGQSVSAKTTTDEDRPFHLSGPVTVTRVSDGDSLRSGALRIRLFGIDAPEMRQACKQPDGTEWPCGVAARDMLQALIADAGQLQCTLMDADRYGRLVMRCFAGDRDIAEAMVAAGMAVAYRRYSDAYIDAENTARQSASGVWQTRFLMPWEWRRQDRVNKQKTQSD